VFHHSIQLITSGDCVVCLLNHMKKDGRKTGTKFIKLDKQSTTAKLSG